ncbi:DUF11 domain-containing protein [Streptomyces sp. NPDC000410]|uniref:DUF11 domain-containing protein n=1 Tax=Streptomyces sp. NPDC000410 TaxID=3154254 RepID=UPI0033278F1B
MSLSLALVPVLGAAGAAGAAEGPKPKTGADLKLDKEAEKSRTTTDELVTYTYTVTNHGPETAANTILTDYIQPNVSGIDLIGGCDVAELGIINGAARFRCFLGDIAPGATETVQFSVAHADPGIYPNVATVVSDTPDPDPRNNEAKAKVVVAGADVKLEKTADPTSGTAPTQVTYTYTVTNKGPSAAEFLQLTDRFPEGADVGTVVAPPGWDCAFAEPSRQLFCSTEGPLAPGETATIQVPVTYATPGTYRNVADVNVLTADPNLLNNRDDATVTVS